MRRILTTLLLSSTAILAHAEVPRGSSLKAAVESGAIRLTATTTGKSYHSKALRLHLSNTTRQAMQLRIDPALVFKPDDLSYQPLVLPAEETFALAPGGSADIDVQTFCGKLHASAPGAKLSYTLWRQGDSNLIKVTQYIRKNSLYDDLGQSAIWALTEGRDLDGVIDPARPKISAELLALMVKLTGRPMPEYFRLYKMDTTAGQPIFQKRILKIVANMEWKLEAPTAVSLGIYNQTGDLVQGVLAEEPLKRGGYKMMVQFEAEGAPPGNYYMRLLQGEKLMKELKVTVE